MLGVTNKPFMLTVVMLTVIMLSVFMLNVVAPNAYSKNFLRSFVYTHQCFGLHFTYSVRIIAKSFVNNYCLSFGLHFSKKWLTIHILKRLHHSQDGSTYSKYKLMCFIYISFFRKEQNTLAFNRDTWCHLALCLQLILLH